MQIKQLHNAITLKDVSLETRPGMFLFKNLNLSIREEKIGLVGKNGTGKTTLLKLITGEIDPSTGEIQKKVTIAYLAQDYQADRSLTVGQTIGAEKEHIMLAALARVHLQRVAPDRLMSSLSGGERARIVIASLLVQGADFLILDEPTNNLDQEARKGVYELIGQWKRGLLVVSHDRALLNLVDTIFELSEKGLKIYGGNYEMYVEQKNLEKEATRRQLADAEKEMDRVKRQAQSTKERQQKRSDNGKKTAHTLGLPKIVLNEMKKHAQQTTSKLNKIHEERVSAVSDNLQNAKDQISPENRIVVDLRRTQIPNGKLVAEFKAVKFSYESKSLFNEFNLIIYGPERLAINGPNGSGKSTLVKLLLGELKPESGEITKCVEHSAYLDQHVAILDKTKTVLENLKLISGLDETMGRNWLARFLFSADDVFKKVEILSGGERVRAALACILAGDTPPKLLVLDEPTNNLDLNSIEQIESALLNFEGALVVISHDKSFLQNIGISKEINLSLW